MADASPERQLPGTIRCALDEVPAIDGVEVLGDAFWVEHDSAWAIPLKVTLGDEAGSEIPRQTTWYVTIPSTYPWGDIDIYPARRGGINTTHPHQQLNIECDADIPWTHGKVCVVESVAVLGREIGEEPFDADTRFAWHLRRLHVWALNASRGTLTSAGEPFELPYFGVDRKLRVAFIESPDLQSSVWSAAPRFGTARLMEVLSDPKHLLLTEFNTIAGDRLVAPELGRWAMRAADQSRPAVWVRLDSVPVQAPWRPPVTWSDLREAVAAQGLDLDDLIRKALVPFRDACPSGLVLLLGFPVPRTWGGTPAQMHWQGVGLSGLASRAKVPAGVRAKPGSFWRYDRDHALADQKLVHWLHSENWGRQELQTRGTMSASVTESRVAVIGCGAVGSALAELLARAGTYRLTLVDHDDLCAGNLVRHVLTMDDVGRNKAERLLRRLSSVSPYADIMGVPESFPPTEPRFADACRRSSMIVDCSASDAVAAELSTFNWGATKTFLSFSLGPEGRQLVCFGVRAVAFPLGEFRSALRPWLQKIRQNGELVLPREGVGCWHPVFPAPAHRVWGLTAAAAAFIDEVAEKLTGVPVIAEFEWEADGSTFVGVRRVR